MALPLAKTALATFRTALIGAGATQCPVVLIGDSIGEGYAATNQRSTGWMYRVKTLLQALYGDGGLGFLGAHRSDLYNWAGSWTAYTTYGVDDQYSTNTSSIVTISAQYCSSFQVIVAAVTSFDASVDGGAYQTYSTAGFGTSIHRMGTVSCGTLGNHTLAIRGPSSGNLHFFGVVPVVSTTGVVVHNLSITGTSAPSWTTTRVAMVPGFAPKLWIIALGVNDAGLIDAANASEPDVASFTTQYQSIVTQAKATGASVLLINEHPTVRTGTASSSDAVQAAVASMADSNAVGYMSFTELWGTYAASASLMNDSLHPNNAGHLLMAQQAISYIYPPAVSMVLPSAASVLAGVDRGNGTNGTLTLPAASTLLAGTDRGDGTVGTLSVAKVMVSAGGSLDPTDVKTTGTGVGAGGTYDAAAAVAAGAAGQLATDQAAIPVAYLLAGHSALSQAGTLPAAKVMVSAGGSLSPANVLDTAVGAGGTFDVTNVENTDRPAPFGQLGIS